MAYLRFFFKVIIVSSLLLTSSSAAENEFDSEQILSDLESQLELSKEKMSDLKPAINTKSAELKKSIHESIDKGFLQLDEMSAKLESVSRDAEKKAGEILNSEEMIKFKNYLSKIDEKAIKEMKDRTVADLSALLELTEAQMLKLKPVLEDSYNQLGGIFNNLAKEGNKSWNGIKKQYEQLSRELREKLQKTLDNNQMEKFEKYNKEKKEKIKRALHSV